MTWCLETGGAVIGQWSGSGQHNVLLLLLLRWYVLLAGLEFLHCLLTASPIPVEFSQTLFQSCICLYALASQLLQLGIHPLVVVGRRMRLGKWGNERGRMGFVMLFCCVCLLLAWLLLRHTCDNECLVTQAFVTFTLKMLRSTTHTHSLNIVLSTTTAAALCSSNNQPSVDNHQSSIHTVHTMHRKSYPSNNSFHQQQQEAMHHTIIHSIPSYTRLHMQKRWL